MNLGQLLGVGRSFFGGDPMAAYRLNKRLCLPKFNEGKNPFASKKSGEAEEGMSALPKPEIKAVTTPVPAPTPKPQPPYAFKPAISARPKAPVPAAVEGPAGAPVAAAKPAARQGWTTRLNPFRAPEPPVRSHEVQEELSLDTVKVLHNDLEDVDVEVVPVKSRPVESAILPPARHAWEYMGEKLLNPG